MDAPETILVRQVVPESGQGYEFPDLGESYEIESRFRTRNGGWGRLTPFGSKCWVRPA
ncbi:hypothetical protein CCP3SC15_80008 [Gammaproteobacteria bacterium]